MIVARRFDAGRAAGSGCIDRVKVMNAIALVDSSWGYVHAAPANDVRRDDKAVRGGEDPMTRAYRVLRQRLRAAAAQYVDRADVDDLVQDVFVVAARQPGKLTRSDGANLSWLIGVAKRCAPGYRVGGVRFVGIEEVLVGEAGDDVEGAEMHAAAGVNGGEEDEEVHEGFPRPRTFAR